MTDTSAQTDDAQTDTDAHVTPITVRFRDLDAMGHVNNAVYATYVEQARATYFREALDLSLDAVRSVIATLTIDYRKPITSGQDVLVRLWIPEIGETSLPMRYEIVADGEIAAVADSVQVWVDEAGAARPIPDGVRERIRSHPSFEDADT